MKSKLPLILALIFFAFAVFFRFALIGYSTLALAFACLSCLCLIFMALGRMKNRRRAKILRRALLVLISIGLVILTVIEIPIIRNSRTDENPEADYLIVLGAGVNGAVPSLTLANRLSAALDYLNSYPDATAIVSGGQGPGEDISEAQAMRVWLESRGIAPERIIMEDKSTSTRENLAFSLPLTEPGASVAIISNDYHLYRAKSIARELGCDAIGVAARTPLPVLTVISYLREPFAGAHNAVFG